MTARHALNVLDLVGLADLHQSGASPGQLRRQQLSCKGIFSLLKLPSPTFCDQSCYRHDGGHDDDDDDDDDDDHQNHRHPNLRQLPAALAAVCGGARAGFHGHLARWIPSSAA